MCVCRVPLRTDSHSNNNGSDLVISRVYAHCVIIVYDNKYTKRTNNKKAQEQGSRQRQSTAMGSHLHEICCIMVAMLHIVQVSVLCYGLNKGSVLVSFEVPLPGLAFQHRLHLLVNSEIGS